jgi:FkbM family methyltransferase
MTGVLSFSAAKRFLNYPRQQKIQAIYSRWRRHLPRLPFPIHLSFGKWWLATGAPLDEQLVWQGGFEEAEMRFVESFLQSGMTALDLGAHHGLYTLLLSDRVGKRGRVFAFEPSDRERKRLKRHVRVNGCSNVRIEALALGNNETRATLFLPETGWDWCNSLRPPAASGKTHAVEVQVSTLDAYLKRRGIEVVDFVKLDVEGAELSVLRGAENLLAAQERPVWLVEVFDLRTKPWGYSAKEIVEFMEQHKYQWFEISHGGILRTISSERQFFDANLVAVPAEKTETVLNALRGN